MSTLEVLVPEEIGDVDECMVVTWLKQEGDAIAQGDTLVILQVEKVSWDLPAPATGRVMTLLAQPGEVVKKGQMLARLQVATLEEARPPVSTEPEPGLTSPTLPAREVRASPIAKRLAREHNIDLTRVTGSGGGGRITEKDVASFIDAQRVTPSTSGAGAIQPAPPQAETMPLVGMRGTIARRMRDSLHSMAQLTLHTEVDVTELGDLYERLKQQAPITYTDLIVRACALALRQHPRLNARLDGEMIRRLSQINVGVAMALDDGLVVPVIMEADRRHLADLAQTRQRLVARAQAGQLTAEEMRGGTFTVTNLGPYDVDGFTPIINPPEAAILGVGRIVEKVVVHQGKIAQRAMMTLSLTFDHRLVDGVPAAAFLQTIKHLLEMPAPLA